jgi:RNA polymerase sigma-70 factor, ECF subfamily
MTETAITKIDLPSSQDRFSNYSAFHVRGATAHWDWPALRARCQREARRVLGDPHDAEDAVQEALTRAWRKRHNCRTPGTPLPWMLQITRNEALRLRDRRRFEPATSEEPHDDAAPAVDPATEQLADRLDIRRALSRLPPQDQVLVRLRYHADLTTHGVAGILDLPEGTVKVRLHRIRERLRTDLTTDGVEGNYQPQ